MSETLILINPQKRPSLRKGKTKMAKAKTKRKVASKPAAKKAVTVTMKAKPAQRKYRRKSAHTKVAKVRRKFKRNPSPLGMSAMSVIKDGFQGALGSVAVNTLVNHVAPANMRTGPMLHVVRLAAAIGVGMLAQKFTGRATAANMARGAVTVALHDAIVNLVGPSIPTLRLGAIDQQDWIAAQTMGEGGNEWIAAQTIGDAPAIPFDSVDSLNEIGAGYEMTPPDLGEYVQTGEYVGGYDSDAQMGEYV